jgi:DNA/RNA-binding domain of Phe-tRNA-synthetase-like protein
MIPITLSAGIARACPGLCILALSCEVKNTASDPELWVEISRREEQMRQTMQLEDVNQWLPVKATRQAYRKLGKDPNRYRPSAEALCRRILRGLPLYRIDTLVDIVNLVSIQSGYSIGAFDVDKIRGNRLELGVGQEGEAYNAIGRGGLNISGLPVYRDEAGGIGTPTSDEERTKIEASTTRLLLLINGYSGPEGLQEAGDHASALLQQYVSATRIEMSFYGAPPASTPGSRDT